MTRSEFKEYMQALSWREFKKQLNEEQSYYGVNLRSFLCMGNKCGIGLYLLHKRYCEYFLSKNNLFLKVMGGVIIC